MTTPSNPSVANDGPRTFTASPRCRPHRVLLAESNPINRDIIASVLQQHGCDVVSLEPMAMLAPLLTTRAPFDIVFVDTEWHGLDALIATMREHRSHLPGRKPAMVALGPAGAPHSDGRFDACITRPIDWSLLLEVVSHYAPPDRRRASGETMPSRIVLDESALAMLDPIIGREKLTKTVGTFLKDLRHRINVVRQPGTTSDTLLENAHALVSLAGHLGFEEVSGLCIELEEMARRGAGLDRVSELDEAASRAWGAAQAWVCNRLDLPEAAPADAARSRTAA